MKYNRPNGRVTVAFQEVENGRMRINITDTGAGIPPAKMALLFQPFERLGAEYTRVEGTGLGLAVSRGLAEAMRGTIGVTSEIDRGSTFWIELALSDEPEPRKVAPAHRETANRPDRAGPRVVHRGQQLERPADGARARAPAGGPPSARAQRRRRLRATAERPNLIFLDLHLPRHGRRRRAALHLGRIAAANIPVAVLSADATSGHVRRLLASGAVAYLTKPLEIAR